MKDVLSEFFNFLAILLKGFAFYNILKHEILHKSTCMKHDIAKVLQNLHAIA